MELLVFGHAGAKVLIFPTRDGRFYEYENMGVVESLRSKIEAGYLQLFCVDSVDHESLYCFWREPHERIRHHIRFEQLIDYSLQDPIDQMLVQLMKVCDYPH